MRPDLRRKNLLRLAFCLLLLSSCTLPGQAAPVVKIGLIAPFEGLGRPLGYQILTAVKIALEDANAGGELGAYRLALVALNDDLEPATAARQVRALAADDSLLGALGPWTSPTAAAAAPAFVRAGLPALVGAPLASAVGAPAVVSLCPPFSDIAARVLAKAGELGPRPVVVAGPPGDLLAALAALLPPLGAGAARQSPSYTLYSGDAAAVAEELARRSPAGEVTLLGGPDLAQPWLAGLAGGAAEGAWALACTAQPAGAEPGLPDGAAARYQAQAGGPAGAQAALAYWGTRRLVSALKKDIGVHGRPSRAGLAAALQGDGERPETVWLQMQSGRFVPR